ncbi:hypothetical protein ACFOLJ_31020 [Rugamonas sp. CCM 8940]|uniref:hypothetical protein n=1 Tax=Rugamonas sp. CCM 8940 TaxID=2765359 RepID=UPI0018F79899|nr:hypothetical protein [Rugamonas sp. CCM 8940]MBJ7309214.1 hypothetical protein [Rugamonas sp. CCM 8940]
MSDKLESIEQLHEAIRSGLAARLAGVPTVLHYPPSESALALPAVLVELAELRPGRDPGTGESALIGRFVARLIVDAAGAKAALALRELAARLALVLKHQNWGLPVGMAQWQQAVAGTGAAGRLEWQLEWSHEFELGAPVWPYPDSSNTQLMLGLDPETGVGKKARYWDAGDVPTNL